MQHSEGDIPLSHEQLKAHWPCSRRRSTFLLGDREQQTDHGRHYSEANFGGCPKKKHSKHSASPKRQHGQQQCVQSKDVALLRNVRNVRNVKAAKLV